MHKYDRIVKISKLHLIVGEVTFSHLSLGMGPQMSTDALMVDQIYDQVFEYILIHDLKTDDRLNVDFLVRTFGVSQTPVRQALTRLQMEGLVTNKPNSGFRIAKVPDDRHLEQILALRLLIEPALAGAAVTVASEKDRATIYEVSENSVVAASEEDYDRFAAYKQDLAFHTAIAHAAGNVPAYHALERLLRESALSKLHRDWQSAHDILEEHRAIADAIREGQSAKAQIAMEFHLRRSIDRAKLH